MACSLNRSHEPQVLKCFIKNQNSPRVKTICHFWFMYCMICILYHGDMLSCYQVKASLIGRWSKRHLQGCTSYSLSTSISLNLSFTLCQSSSGLTSVADRWQSHFHSGVVPCYLGAKPCNSYKCHIKSRPVRWEWQSDREASHNHYYLHLCGGHPQIEMCSSCVPVQTWRHVGSHDLYNILEQSSAWHGLWFISQL